MLRTVRKKGIMLGLVKSLIVGDQTLLLKLKSSIPSFGLISPVLVRSSFKPVFVLNFMFVLILKKFYYV